MIAAPLRLHFARRLAALGMLTGLAGPLAAQGLVSGRVTDQANGAPLVGARVMVVGTSLTTTTNADGRFRLPGAPVGPAQVRASQIGYASVTKSVNVADQSGATVDFALVLTPYSLDEVVVTATGDQAKREVGNAVSTVDAAQLVQTSPVTNMNDLLAAKAPGVQVMPGNTTGTGGRVRIRGNSSLSLSNNPIYIIDGVRMVSDVGSISIGLGGSAPTRVNDLNPEDIESIDVVRGPSAASLYGTDAANGVIVIRTKRGKAGRPVWNAYAEQGFIRDQNNYPINYRGWCTRPAAGSSGCSSTSTTSNTSQCLLAAVVTTNAAARCIQDSTTSFDLWRDKDSSPIAGGYRNQLGVQVSGGSDVVRYYLSSEFEHETGPLRMPDVFQQRIMATRNILSVPDEQARPSALRRVNIRANIAAQLNDKMDINVTSGYISSGTRYPQIDNNANGIGSNGFGGPGFKNFMLTPAGGPTRNNLGWRSSTPDEMFSIMTDQGINRSITSGTFNYRPTSWLAARVVTGLDFIAREDTQLCRLNECTFLGTNRTGFKANNRTTFFDYTGDASATATYRFSEKVRGKTVAGLQFVKENNTRTTTFAENLPPGATTVGAGSVNISAGEATTTSVTLGYFLEEQVSWNDRIYFNGAIRSDRNSAFGNQFKRVYYPKLSVSYVLSDEPFFPKSDVLSSLRLRFAYGASGRQPGANDALLFFTPTPANVDQANVPGLVLSALGNPNLKPERSAERELGFDASIAQNRINLEFTYYKKTSRDALISRILAPSAGTAASRLENIGEVSNEGVEAAINAMIVDSKSFSWDLTATASYNRNKIVSLGGTPPNRGTTNSDVEGYPIQGWWLRPFTFKDVNGDGIIQGDTATAVREVFVGDTAVYVGPSIPPGEFTAYNTFSMFGRKLQVQTLLDSKVGGYQLNGNERIRCDTRLNCRGDVDRTAPLSEQARAIALRVHPSKTQYGYVEKTSFIRLREVSATFTLPDRWARYFSASQVSITAAARNLGVITGYSGMDPEGGYFGDNIGVVSDFQTPPPPTYYTFRVNVRF